MRGVLGCNVIGAVPCHGSGRSRAARFHHRAEEANPFHRSKESQPASQPASLPACPRVHVPRLASHRPWLDLINETNLATAIPSTLV